MLGLPEEWLNELERVISLVKKGGLLEDVRGLLAFGPGPRLDVVDEGDKVRLIIEAPGWLQDRKRWTYRLAGGQLLLKGELLVEESVHDNQGRYYSERLAERFTRIVPLPAVVDEKPLKIAYREGILTLIFRKNPHAPKFSDWREIPYRA